MSNNKERIIRRIKRNILFIIRIIPDKIRNVDFSKEVIWSEPNMKEYSRYSMSTYKLFRKVKKYLKNINISNDSILDIGCGKGKAIELLNKAHGRDNSKFKSIDGLDFSKELCTIAKSNMSRLKIKSNIYNSDATTFNNYNKYTYFYMFNPLKGKLLEKTIKRIKSSLKTNPRTIHIIYSNPWSRDILINEDFVSECKLAKYVEVFRIGQ